MKINIVAAAKKKGLNTAYALQKALACSPTLASRLWTENFKRIDIQTLESLCDLFNCQPNDLLVYTPRKKSSSEPLTTKPPAKPVTTSAASSFDGLLSTKEVADRLNLSRKRVNDYIVSGELKATKGKQNHNFVSEADLLTFIESRNK